MRLNLPKETVFYAKPPLWKRVLAFLIDLSIVNLVIATPFRNILVQLIPQDKSFNELYAYVNMNPGISYVIYVVTILIALLLIVYFTVLEWGMGQTIGKRLLGLFVVQDLDKKELTSKFNFTSPGFWQCLIRHIILIPIAPFIIFWVFDILMSFFSKKQQRLFETLTRTRVISEYRG